MTTQFATASYQEIIDVHTESDRLSVLGIHTPCSDTPYRMLKGFWNQFKKFKYNGCSVSLVPAARLPADIAQVGYGAGEAPIDSRDLLNPILFHGCHGNDMGTILNGLYSASVNGTGFMDREIADSVENNVFRTNIVGDDFVEALYYKALTDNTWMKAHPQKGFRKSGLHPLVYSLASNMQLNPAGLTNTSANHFPPAVDKHNDAGVESRTNSGTIGYNSGNLGVGNPVGRIDYSFQQSLGGSIASIGGDASGLGFFTPRLQRLGWMDTRQVVGSSGTVNSETLTSSNLDEHGNLIGAMIRDTRLVTMPVYTPRIFMGMCMLPPAYKTEQYFRLVINHSFSFAKFRGASMQYDDVGMVNNAYSVFNFNADDSKHGPEPEPEPDPKDKVSVETVNAEVDPVSAGVY